MPTAQLPEGVAESLLRRLHNALAFTLADVTPIDPGVIHNNRLYRLRSTDGRDLVAKVYYRDDRRRLEREFGSFRFLHARGLTSVPVAYFADADEQYAVYSFEPGRSKAPSELTPNEMAAIGRLAADLQRFTPADVAADVADFPRGFAAGSLAEYAESLRSRLATCLRAATAPDAYLPLRSIVGETDLPAEFERLIAAALGELTAAELAAPVQAEHLRLNPGDFAPHNILIRPDGELCAIDFEYVCWEDPASLPAGFLAAEQSDGLTSAQAETFLRAYHAHRGVPDAAFGRYGRLRILMELSWAVVNLSLMTPAHVARKRFAGDFDLDTHLMNRRLRLVDRLARAEALIRTKPI